MSAEDLIVYCARVSNPKNQTNFDTSAKLLRYCIKHGHWSVFEMADWTVEIETSRAISAQILRHRSFSFQEFSQRYADIRDIGEVFEPVEFRQRAEGGNRQGSGLPLPELEYIANIAQDEALRRYEDLINKDVAPESARMILPMCVKTRLYMKGSVRSWIHYLKARCDLHTQTEHREIALAILGMFHANFPTIAEAAFNE